MKRDEWIMVFGFSAIVLSIWAGFRGVQKKIDDIPEDLLRNILR